MLNDWTLGSGFGATAATIAISLCLAPLSRAAPPPQTLFSIQRMIEGESQPLYLIDGALLFYTGAPSAGQQPVRYRSIAQTMEVRTTHEGALLILRPKAEFPDFRGRNNADSDGLFLTGDYSTDPPSIKFTRAPEKYSYWEIPMEASGAIINKNDLNRPAYLSVGNDRVVFNDYFPNGPAECRPAILAYKSADKFRVVSRPTSGNVDRPRIVSIETKDKPKDDPMLWGVFSPGGVHLVDGKLLVWSKFAFAQDAQAKSFDFDQRSFELRDSPEGTQIILRPRAAARAAPITPSETFELDGYYLTVDYSGKEPSLKFTKEPERSSHWEIIGMPEKARFEGAQVLIPNGPVLYKNELGQKVYLSIAKEPAYLIDRATNGTIAAFPLSLSSKPDHEFRFVNDNPRDGL